jgi:hypothetical protein
MLRSQRYLSCAARTARKRRYAVISVLVADTVDESDRIGRMSLTAGFFLRRDDEQLSAQQAIGPVVRAIGQPIFPSPSDRGIKNQRRRSSPLRSPSRRNRGRRNIARTHPHAHAGAIILSPECAPSCVTSQAIVTHGMRNLQNSPLGTGIYWKQAV